VNTTQAITVRRAATADLPGLLESDAYASSHPERHGFLTEAVERGECIGAFFGGQPVGYIVLNHSFFGRGFVPLVVVTPSMRRQGVAQSLFVAAESLCKTETLFTSTNASNTEAQRLLERIGFKRSGSIENLDAGDSELVYFKRCAVAGESLEVNFEVQHR
jgi:ribosomal protein S18 acetylase RimI-like enzyme